MVACHANETQPESTASCITAQAPSPSITVFALKASVRSQVILN